MVAAPVGPAVALPGGSVSILVVGSNGEVYERRKVEEVRLDLEEPVLNGSYSRA